MTKLLKLSGAESLSVAGNIFLGQTESPLMIKAYLANMNRSEILLVMTGGMATLAGGVLAAYIAFFSMGNFILTKIGSLTGINSIINNFSDGQFNELSLQVIFGYIFAPLMWVLGVCI